MLSALLLAAWPLPVALPLQELFTPRPPEAYLHPADQERARRKDPNDLPCATYVRERPTAGLDSIVVVSFLPTDQCLKMLPPQRMRGVWLDEFEGSQFFPDRETAPGREERRRRTFWLAIERGQLPAALRLRSNTRVMLIEFIGRRTEYSGPSGHFGMFDHEVIVDRVISAREIPAAPHD